MATMNVDDIVACSKDLLLSSGDYPPMIHVELDREGYAIVGIPQLASLDNAWDRAHLAFSSGRWFGQTNYKKELKGKKVTGVCLVTKVWMGLTPLKDIQEGKPMIRASKDPNRKEGLNISTIEADTLEQDNIFYEILRDGSGKVVDLFKDSAMVRTGPVMGAFLPCFLAGFKSRDQHESLASHEFRRTFERYAPPIYYAPGP